MLALSVLSLVLLALDHYSTRLDSTRSVIGVLVTPVVVIADYPSRAVMGLQENFASRAAMREQIAQMAQEQLLLRAKTEKMASLTA